MLENFTILLLDRHENKTRNQFTQISDFCRCSRVNGYL